MASDTKKPKTKPFLAKSDDKLAAVLDAEIKRMIALGQDIKEILTTEEEATPAKVRLRKFTMEICGEFLIELAHTASVKQACANLGISRTSYNNFITKSKTRQGKRLWFTVQMLAAPNKKARAGAVKNYIDETYRKKRRLTKK